MRRLFETNFWGVVNGSRAAANHLKTSGGALINVGSVLSDRAIPVQGVYSASKHAVKGFTDALRMELEAESYPISVTLIKPSAINTPYTEHARNLMPQEPQIPPPVYAPDLVAEAILYCAENPTRDFTVGEGGKMISLVGNLAPRLTDKAMEWSAASMQQKASPEMGNRPESLYSSRSDLRERGSYDGVVFENSLYQRTKLNPLLTSAILFGGAAALAALLKGNQRRATNGNETNHRHLDNEQPRSLEVGHS